MEPCIYTIGSAHKTLPDIIPHLHKYGVNCVVDIRTNIINGRIPGMMPDDMKEVFPNEGIIYMQFFKEFGLTPPEVTNNRGEAVYTKFVKQPSFQQGVGRIKNGISKGYTIIILDSDRDVFKNKRHHIIGKYFTSVGIAVKHIEDDGSILSYEKVNEILARKAEALKEKKYKANELGTDGEEIAGMHLLRQGHTILDRNWNLHHGCELDIITRKDGVLYFVEVKTRRSNERGTPHLAIDRQKVHNMTTAIKEYIYRNSYFDLPYKVMSIAIVYRSDEDYDIDFLEWGNSY